jgi:D-tagatose-1,6-bisphosphate aldolase subunit GatZ/KbaZ
MHLLKEILDNRKTGSITGIPSICTANPIVLKATMLYYKHNHLPLLIEATANQVNQYGGYTQMIPSEFMSYIMKLADSVGFPKQRIILGGDHLGPLVWSKEDETSAMYKAKILINDFVLAGFTKIHLDTSMRLGNDPINEVLDVEKIAQRGIDLLLVAEKAYEERLVNNPEAIAPVYIIGSEVPIPGGAVEEEHLQITTPQAFIETVAAYKKLMIQKKLEDVMPRVIGVVVQPGVEFGDDKVHEYDHQKARNLISGLDLVPGVVFEGHSTDYQTPQSLKNMVEDGIAILKVGPELTFALREGLYALEAMELELMLSQRSNFRLILDQEMLKHPETWERHYQGSNHDQAFKRAFSFSDRSRYVMLENSVQMAIQQLITNTHTCPMPLISQWMPIQYEQIRLGKLQNNSEFLVYDWVWQVLSKYVSACTRKKN